MHLLSQWRGRLGSLLLLCVACPIAGQAPTGSITGEIHDPTGASVGGAQLVLRDVATEALRSTTASLLGSYEFPQLTPGVYDLSIEAKGFRRTVERHIVVNVGSAVHLDVTMPLGDVSETVEVNAEPPLIEPDKVSIGSIVDLHSIQYLPLEDRQFLNLDSHRTRHNSWRAGNSRCRVVRRDVLRRRHAQPVKQLYPGWDQQ